MKRSFCLILIKLMIFSGLGSVIYASPVSNILLSDVDTVPWNQILYNGRVWRDLYAAVHEDQFLFSYDFMPGTVTINGERFGNLKLRYDILNDEVMTITDKGLILQLNKEMVNGFTMIYNLRIYEFLNLNYGTTENLSGYVNVRYSGKTAMYIKQKKEISKVAAGKNYENFVQYDRTYIVVDSVAHRIKGNKDFKVLLSDKKAEVKNYMRTNRIKVSKKMPDSYVPVLQYYDSLKP